MLNAGFLLVTTGESIISPGSRLSNELFIDFLGLSMSKIDFAVELGGAAGGGGGGGAASAGGRGGGGGNGGKEGNDGGGGGAGTAILPTPM